MAHFNAFSLLICIKSFYGHPGYMYSVNLDTAGHCWLPCLSQLVSDYHLRQYNAAQCPCCLLQHVPAARAALIALLWSSVSGGWTVHCCPDKTSWSEPAAAANYGWWLGPVLQLCWPSCNSALWTPLVTNLGCVAFSGLWICAYRPVHSLCA